MTKRSSIVGSLGLAALCLAFSAGADERILVVLPPVFEQGAPIAGTVARDCNVEQLIGSRMVEGLAKRFSSVGEIQHPDGAGNQRYLLLKIQSVLGVGGGNWSGAKAITIRVDLYDNAKLAETQVFSRNSRGGVLGGVSGTCPIMDRIAKQLGEDAAKWVARSSMAATAAPPAFLVQFPAVLDNPSARGQAVNCAVETMVSSQVFQEIRKRYREVGQTQDAVQGSARSLRMTILSIKGSLGAGMEMSVRGEVLQDAKVLGSKVFVGETPAQDIVKGGTFCYFAEHAAAIVGRDIAAWLFTRKGEPQDPAPEQPVQAAPDAQAEKAKQ